MFLYRLRLIGFSVVLNMHIYSYLRSKIDMEVIKEVRPMVCILANGVLRDTLVANTFAPP